MPQLSTFHSQLSAFPAEWPYNSELSLWLSVDPLSDKYPGVSPYVYCGNNPVRLVDKDGREIWVPGLDDDNNIIVTMENGDDFNSFKSFMGLAYSEEDLQNMYGQMQDGKINLTNTYGGVFQLMTDAITNANNDSYFEVGKNYNCWGAAIAVSKGHPLHGNGADDIQGVGIKFGWMFDAELQNNYSQCDVSGASVGKTVMRFAYYGANPCKGGLFGENITTHGAIYMGTSRSGDTYCFTKNGWYYRPKIDTVFHVGLIYSSRVTGLNCGQGYFNYNGNE